MDNDKVFNVEGINLIVEEDLIGAIKGAEIEYKEGAFKKGFEVTPIIN